MASSLKNKYKNFLHIQLQNGNKQSDRQWDLKSMVIGHSSRIKNSFLMSNRTQMCIDIQVVAFSDCHIGILILSMNKNLYMIVLSTIWKKITKVTYIYLDRDTCK